MNTGLNRPAALASISWRLSVVAFLLWGSPLIAHAHRLDEYLQTTFISVEPDHIDLEISLTPGVSVASGILAQIDRDRDGRISTSEGTAYARQVLNAVNLEVDQSPRTLSLTGNQFGSTEELRAGVGLIRINLRAELPSLAPGQHQLSFQNHHATNVSVYLVNALIPASRLIEITRQSRDRLQSGTRIDFTVADAAAGQSQPERPPRAGLPGSPALGRSSLLGVIHSALPAPTFSRGNVGEASSRKLVGSSDPIHDPLMKSAGNTSPAPPGPTTRPWPAVRTSC